MDETFEEPEILVQIWGVNAQENLTDAEMAARNQAVFNEFSSTELAAIDGVTSHFYFTEGLNSGAANEHTLGNLDGAMANMFAMMNFWQTNTNTEIFFNLTEWNVNLHRPAPGCADPRDLLERCGTGHRWNGFLVDAVSQSQPGRRHRTWKRL